MYFFIGIKGTGMGALACILHDRGEEVMGSDLSRHFFTEDALVERGIKIVDFDAANIKDGMTVIIGNAFADDFPEAAAALNNPTCKCYRYHQFLGELMKDYCSIAISGSHGKTTTTGMVKDMLGAYEPTGYLIGDGDGHINPGSKYFVVEADEFRRHFMAYHPDYAIVTNVDLDHVDYFKSEEDYRSAYEDFLKQVKKLSFVNGDDQQARMMEVPSNVVWFGLNEGNDIRALNLEETPDHIAFNVIKKGEDLGRIQLPFVGRHMFYDAFAAVCIGLETGLTLEQIQKSLAAFSGVKRRFVIEERGENIFVDDYAHHPTEVKATISAAKTRWPDRKIVAIFKPHRVSRVVYFAKQFKEALQEADYVGLCEFNSIDDREPGFDESIGINYLAWRIPGSVIFHETEEEAKELAKQGPAVFLFMSSKDIYLFKDKVRSYL